MSGFVIAQRPKTEAEFENTSDGKRAIAVDFLVGEKVFIDGDTHLYGTIVCISITQSVVYEVHWWNDRQLYSGWFHPYRLTLARGRSS